MTITECLHCGEPLSGFSPGLRTVMALSKVEKDLHVAHLMAIENATETEAEGWLHHHYYSECIQKTAACPQCSGQLRTWRARWCPHCKHSWFPENAHSPGIE